MEHVSDNSGIDSLLPKGWKPETYSWLHSRDTTSKAGPMARIDRGPPPRRVGGLLRGMWPHFCWWWALYKLWCREVGVVAKMNWRFRSRGVDNKSLCCHGKREAARLPSSTFIESSKCHLFLPMKRFRKLKMVIVKHFIYIWQYLFLFHWFFYVHFALYAHYEQFTYLHPSFSWELLLFLPEFNAVIVNLKTNVSGKQI